MVKYQYGDNSICIIKSDAGKEWRMMKKVDKKKIILSVLLSSMLWSNSLYAYELSENVLSGDIRQNELENDKSFEEVIVAGNKTKIYKLLDNEKLILKGVTTGVQGVTPGVQFTNVEKIENSTLGTVMGGYIENASNNNLVVTNTKADTIYGGISISNSDNNIVTVNNRSIDSLVNVNGGLAMGDGGLLGGDTKGKITANGNQVYVNGGSIENVYGGSAVLQIESTNDLEANNNLTEINYCGDSDNKVVFGIISGGAVTTAHAGVTWDSSNNTVNINDSFFVLQNNNGTGILGGVIKANPGISVSGTATANNNKINIKNSSINVTDASMGITGGYVSEDSSGELTSANNNSVSIDNSVTYGPIFAGRNDNGEANYNSVIISNNSAIMGTVVGGFASGTSASNNIVEINGSNNLFQAFIFGWDREDTNEKFIHENNKLVINNFSGAVGGIKNFNKIVFNDIKWNTSPEMEIVPDDVVDSKMYEYKMNGGIIVTDFGNVDAIEIGKLGNNNLKTGDKAWLIFTQKNNNDEIRKFNERKFKNYSGVAKIVSGNLLYENDVELTVSNYDGTTQPMPAGALSAVVTGVERNKQVDLVASNRAVAAAFVNQGTDLIADSLDTLSRDGKYGVKTFAAVHGNRSKYDVNSDIKINGWSTIVGVGAENEHNGGDFSWGVFYENGSGNYRTYNDFNNEFFRGDGSLVYNGGGIAARYENSHGVYTEGSLRAGMLKSEMTDALSDGENKYGYESETAYYGAHIGVGKIFSLGDDSDLDVYGKFFHTYTEGDSFNVAGDEFEFDSINSDRLRIGARVTSNKENKFSTYYGLAYEYEFNGDAEMRAAGMKAPTQSLQGSSVMAEIGLNYQPTPDSPWSFDLNMRGYAGERQGGSFNVQATYTF